MIHLSFLFLVFFLHLMLLLYQQFLHIPALLQDSVHSFLYKIRHSISKVPVMLRSRLQQTSSVSSFPTYASDIFPACQRFSVYQYSTGKQYQSKYTKHSHYSKRSGISCFGASCYRTILIASIT